MKTSLFRSLLIILSVSLLSGCFIRINTTPGGVVKTESGNFPDCQSAVECPDIPVVDQFFDETFVAVPDQGYEFVRWISAQRHFFGCSTDSEVRLYTSELESIGLDSFLAKDDVFLISPLFRSTGPDVEYSSDFECNDINSEALGEKWVSYVNIFEADGSTYVGGFPIDGGAPNGGNISALTKGEGGPDQGARQLSVFSFYDSEYNGQLQHERGQFVEVNVYKEYPLGADAAGTYVFTFDAKLPGEGALTSASQAIAFAKVLDPGDSYQPTEAPVTIDTSDLTTTWESRSIEITITSEMAGMLLQFGFANTATNYDPTAIIYDNVSFKIAPDS